MSNATVTHIPVVHHNLRFDPTRQIAIVWDIDDVKGLDDSVSDAQAMEVLRNFERHHEGSMEQMWYDLQYHLDEVKGSN